MASISCPGLIILDDNADDFNFRDYTCDSGDTFFEFPLEDVEHCYWWEVEEIAKDHNVHDEFDDHDCVKEEELEKQDQMGDIPSIFTVESGNDETSYDLG